MDIVVCDQRHRGWALHHLAPEGRQESDMFYLPPNFRHGEGAAALRAMRASAGSGPMSVRDLAILGEAAVILSRLQYDATLEARACELAGLGRATIQLVLDGTIEQSGTTDLLL